MNLKNVVQRAVKRWNEKRMLEAPCGHREVNTCNVADSAAKQRENIQRMDERLSHFIAGRYSLRFNRLTDCTEIKLREEPESAFRMVTVRETNALCLQAHVAGISCWDRDILRHVQSSCVEAYHPFSSYFDALPVWDGKDRLDELARRVSDDAVWVRGFCRWMHGVAAQWSGMNDGSHGLCVAPLLVSDRQGLGKSTFCRVLMPPELRNYYTDSLDLSSTRSAERCLVEMGLINLDEFDRISSKKQPLLKNLMQTGSVCIRRAYKHHACVLPRLAAFIGTSNSRELLTDPTGSRRFLCVSVTRPIDCRGIDHAQVYAQLKAALLSGERYWFNAEEEEDLMLNNAPYYRTYPAEELFLRFFRAARPDEECRLYSLPDILSRIRKLCPGAMSGVRMQNFSQALIAAGVRKVHTQYGNRYKLVEL